MNQLWMSVAEDKKWENVHQSKPSYWETSEIKKVLRNERSSHPEVFSRKGVLQISSKFAEEHLCRSVILMKVLCNFIDIALWHGCYRVNLLHSFRIPFFKNTSGRLLLFSVFAIASKWKWLVFDLFFFYESIRTF